MMAIINSCSHHMPFFANQQIFHVNHKLLIRKCKVNSLKVGTKLPSTRPFSSQPMTTEEKVVWLHTYLRLDICHYMLQQYLCCLFIGTSETLMIGIIIIVTVIIIQVITIVTCIMYIYHKRYNCYNRDHVELNWVDLDETSETESVASGDDVSLPPE